MIKSCNFVPKFQMYSAMIDLKNPKWEEFDIIEMPKHDLKSGQKVRCTFYRAVPGASTPDTSRCQVTDMPKEWYDEFFQKRV